MIVFYKYIYNQKTVFAIGALGFSVPQAFLLHLHHKLHLLLLPSMLLTPILFLSTAAISLLSTCSAEFLFAVMTANITLILLRNTKGVERTVRKIT